MDNGLLLAILAGVFYVLVLPGLVIFALVRVARLNQELGELRQAHRALLARLTQLTPITPSPPSPPSPMQPPDVPSEAPVVTPSEAPSVILSEAKDPASPATASAQTQGSSLRSERRETPPPANSVILSEAKDPASPVTSPVVMEGPSLRSGRQETPSPEPREPTRITLEQLLGGRALAWIGAVAITLAGIFLVKYSIDQGWLGPSARVLLAGLLGVVLIGAGEGLRGRDARIAQALSAAGVAVLYAALFAAVALYELLPRGPGLGLAALLTALSVMLALRQGPFVALLGLIGGALAPALIAERTGDPLTLFAYLLALIGGVMAVLHRQAARESARGPGWWWLGWCALIAGGLWAGLWLALGYEPDGIYPVGIFLLALALLALWAMRADGTPQEGGNTLSFLALSITGALAALLVWRSDFALFPWAVLLALGAVAVWLARRHGDARQYAAAIVPALSLIVFWYWGLKLLPAIDGSRFALQALIVGVLLAAMLYAALWRAARPATFAALAAATVFLHFAIVCAMLYAQPFAVGWSGIALLLALVLALAALPVGVARRRLAQGETTLTALAMGAIALVALAVPLEFSREWITMAYALMLPAVAALAWRLHLPLLRWLVWLLAATVTIRLVFNPYVLDYDVSGSPILNWVLYGYGTAILCYAATAWLLDRMAAVGWAAQWLADWTGKWLLRAVEASLLAFGFLLLTLEVRAFFHPEGLGRAVDRMVDAELYAYSIVWLLFGAALLVAGIVRRSIVLRYASLLVLVVSVVKVFAIDMAGLTGLLRVASFLGLGIGLLALGFIYRRYVFAEDRPPVPGR